MTHLPRGLGKLIERGETEALEFKRNFDKKVLITAGALANTRGGVILIGVDEDGTTTGIEVTDEILKDWANHISNASEPMLIPLLERGARNGKTIVAIRVKEFPLKPVAILGRCYRRLGASNRQMTPSEIAEMHARSIGSTWDALPSIESTLDDLDLTKFHAYIARAREVGRRRFDEGMEPAMLMSKLELIRGTKPTLAALMVFGRRAPIQAKVKCGRIRGTSTIVDDYVVESPLLEQVDDVMAYMRRTLQLSYAFTGKGEREEVWEYPLNAVKEAVTNAICHRDYSSPAETQIKVFDDRMTIWNPGPLPPGMTIATLLDPAHNSVPRNKLIAMLFYDAGLIERYGSGIGRMLDECRRLSFPPPEFDEFQAGFQVVFHKDIYTEKHLAEMGLNPRQSKAVHYSREHGSITNKEYQDLNAVSNKTAYLDLNDLMDKGMLKAAGSGRQLRYVLK